MIIHNNKGVSLKRYKKEAVSMLHDFYIKVTPEIREAINARTSEVAIDNYCKTIIDKYFEERNL